MNTTFAALAVRDFRLQWIASTLATTAFMTTFVLVPIVAYQLTGSYASSGIAAMGNGVGMLFLTPYGGVLADRLPKKPVVLWGQFATVAVIAVTGALIVTDLITVPLLFASTLLSGAAFALTGPARQSWIAELVPERLVPNAVALQQMGINVAQVSGTNHGLDRRDCLQRQLWHGLPRRLPALHHRRADDPAAAQDGAKGCRPTLAAARTGRRISLTCDATRDCASSGSSGC